MFLRELQVLAALERHRDGAPRETRVRYSFPVSLAARRLDRLEKELRTRRGGRARSKRPLGLRNRAFPDGLQDFEPQQSQGLIGGTKVDRGADLIERAGELARGDERPGERRSVFGRLWRKFAGMLGLPQRG